MTRSAEPRVLQSRYGYGGPFLDCAYQCASLSAGAPYKVTTVFLTGRFDPEVTTRYASDEVLFLRYGSRDIRGLKLKAIRNLREIARSRDLRFCIVHRFKLIWITSLVTCLPIVGVHHAFGDYQRLSRKVFTGLMSECLSLPAVSDAVRDDIHRCLPKWSAERIKTLYDCVDVAVLQAEQAERLSARRQPCLPDEAWVIDNVGRLHPDKDQTTLLRSFAATLLRLPQNSLLATLDNGRLEEQPKDLVCELDIGEHVLLLDQVEEARRYFKAFDTSTLSSDHKPFGMVLLEVMVAGVLLIATAYSGAREVVERVGILFPLDDEMAPAEGPARLTTLDRRQREACMQLMLERLEVRFSDAVVRREFWCLLTTAGSALGSVC